MVMVHEEVVLTLQSPEKRRLWVLSFFEEKALLTVNGETICYFNPKTPKCNSAVLEFFLDDIFEEITAHFRVFMLKNKYV